MGILFDQYVQYIALFQDYFMIAKILCSLGLYYFYDFLNTPLQVLKVNVLEYSYEQVTV